MRQRLVDSYIDPVTTITYGLRGDPGDFELSQQYAHDHVTAVTRVLMTAGLAATEVSGFDYTLAGGLSLSIAAGQAFDAAGNFYETVTDPAGQPAVVTLDAADATNPRIDLVYILLESGVQAEPLPRTFRRLRTPSELAANVAPYTPTNFTQFAEAHTRATVLVHKGTPGAVPAVPALNAGEVALFQVRVNAGAAVLVSGNVTDVRNKTRSLAQAWAQIDLNTAALQSTSLNETIDDRVNALLVDTASVVRTYNDGANTLQFDVPAEYIQDVVGAFIGAGSGVTVSYNDAANTFTVSLDVEYLQDQVAAFTSGINGVVATYNDAGNSLSFSLDVEYVQDMIASFLGVTVNTGLSLTYNDAGNALTLAGVAATQTVMGMLSAADKLKLDSATSAATVSTLVMRDANGDVTHRRVTSTIATGTSPFAVSSTTECVNLNATYVQGQNLASLDSRFWNATGDTGMTGKYSIISDDSGSGNVTESAPSGNIGLKVVYRNTVSSNATGIAGYGQITGNCNGIGVYGKGHGLGAGGNNPVAYGGYFETQQDGTPTTPTSYGIFATNNGQGTPGYAGYFSGNVTITGSITKGSGTFHIDHPVDPDNYDLVYGFCESPEYLNTYRVRARLAAGQSSVNLDEYYGHMAGTFAAANQDADVWGVMAVGHGAGQVSASAIEGGTFTLSSTDPEDAREVRVLIFAARADQLIRVNQYVGPDGRLVSQQPKPALTEADVEMLAPVTEIVEGPPGSETTVETRMQILPSLIGKQGFRRNPEAFGQGLPAAEITVITVPAPEPTPEPEPAPEETPAAG